MKQGIYLVLTISLLSCLKEAPLSKSYEGYSPRDIGDGWSIGSSLHNDIDSNALNSVFRSVHDEDDYWPMRSLSVFRNGELIAETYLKSEGDRTRPRAIWSCTKQVMALLAGTHIDNNQIFLTDRIEQFIPRYTDQNRNKKDILISDLLTMKSGIGFHNDEHSDVYRKRETDNSVTFALGLDLEATPGTRFNYNDGDPQILSAVFQDINREKSDQLAKERIFDVIGFNNYEWRRYPNDGVTMGGFGILTTPRELAKIGQLVLNKGSWDTTQVISEAYINDMLTEHSKLSTYPELRFGYYWWIHPEKEYYFMWGHGGQYVFLIPEKNAMVVITSLEQIESDSRIDVREATSLVDRIKATMN